MPLLKSLNISLCYDSKKKNVQNRVRLRGFLRCTASRWIVVCCVVGYWSLSWTLLWGEGVLIGGKHCLSSNLSSPLSLYIFLKALPRSMIETPTLFLSTALGPDLNILSTRLKTIPLPKHSNCTEHFLHRSLDCKVYLASLGYSIFLVCTNSL